MPPPAGWNVLALRVARWYQVQGVRHPAAALRRGRVDDAIDDVQGVRLAVGGQELVGGSDVRTVGRVDLVKPPVPCDRVNRVLARRHLLHRRHRGLAAEAERVVQRSGGRCERALVALRPQQIAAADVDAEQIVGDAGDDRDLSRASRRGHAFGDQRRKKVVHLARLAIELDLPQQRHVLDVGEGEDFLVFHPAGPAGIVAFGQVVGRHQRDARREHRHRHRSSKTQGRLSEVLAGYRAVVHRVRARFRRGVQNFESFRSRACVSPSDSVKGVPRLAPALEQIRITFLAGLQVLHGNRQIPAGRQALNRESALLIGTRALDEARVRPPLHRIVGKHDDGGVERHAAAVVRHTARDGSHRPLCQLDLESVDVRGEVQRRVGDVHAFPPDALHPPIAHRAGADEATAPEPLQFEGPVVVDDRRTARARHLDRSLHVTIHQHRRYDDLRRAKPLRRVARVETDPASRRRAFRQHQGDAGHVGAVDDDLHRRGLRL